MKHAGNRRLYRPNHVALMRDVARREDFYALVRFGRTVTGARWDEGTYRCRVETAEYERHVCRVLVSGMGPLHAPRLPDVPGLDRFRGPAFHSARWDDDAELAGMVWQVGGCRSW